MGENYQLSEKWRKFYMFNDDIPALYDIFGYSFLDDSDYIEFDGVISQLIGQYLEENDLI